MKRTMVALAAATSLLISAPAVASAAGPGWAGGWAASAQPPTAGFEPNWSLAGFSDQSVRQVVRLTAGGPLIRIRLSTVHSGPVSLAGATIARTAEGGAVRPGSLRRLTFGHRAGVEIPAGREIASDAAALPVGPLDEVTVTLHFARPTGPTTFHEGAAATSFRAAGDHLSDPSGAAFTETTHSWYFLTGVDVLDTSPRRDTVVAFGDSITDGAGSTVDADNRYPDELAERLHGRFGVLNEGIGGNRVLSDSPCFGEAATKRFARDVLSRPDVRSVIVLEGINDIIASDIEFECFVPNPEVTAADLIAGHRSLLRQAHARGVRVIGATVTPVKGFAAYSERIEAVRTELNTWIRTSGEYDAVADFDRALADPADPRALLAAYDSGDHVHPNDAGYHAMAAAVDLRAL
ncbi:SGNH/GDSL hydrolase family protein [Umezawaea endophytica]|uniref:SGNH/GDSL hydrolase family protein n=1 Tax=Umezawaea endophytica TaxID=1654476 RepID=A0A9X2VRM3_9PSEU|nr:SGNH/GDSL hydrolase family protein [Umezawaea endophytica]MCS7481460.1 SGNH/GDSL hydrolase family protein [Umezawaea endophytica]